MQSLFGVFCGVPPSIQANVYRLRMRPVYYSSNFVAILQSWAEIYMNFSRNDTCFHEIVVQRDSPEYFLKDAPIQDAHNDVGDLVSADALG